MRVEGGQGGGFVSGISPFKVTHKTSFFSLLTLRLCGLKVIYLTTEEAAKSLSAGSRRSNFSRERTQR